MKQIYKKIYKKIFIESDTCMLSRFNLLYTKKEYAYLGNIFIFHMLIFEWDHIA